MLLFIVGRSQDLLTVVGRRGCAAWAWQDSPDQKFCFTSSWKVRALILIVRRDTVLVLIPGV